MQRNRRPDALLFINTTHPSDATTRDSLSQIRSHAAREIRSRARKSREAVLISGHQHGKKPRKQSIPKNRSKEDETQSDLASCSKKDLDNVKISAPVISPLQLRGPNPAMSISYFAPTWSSVRPFSNKENLLLDHYLNYIIPYSNGSCHRNKDISNDGLIDVQYNYWIPFALSDLGLIAALFLQSCRSLKELNPAHNYANLSTEYRLQCIQSTNADLSNDRAMQISDATIAKVMIMASDEFAFGNYNGWSAHLAAISQMIEMRGGLDALGVGGFLKEVIMNTPICFGY